MILHTCAHGVTARCRFIHLSDVDFREQALKKRLALVQDSLTSVLSDSNPPRRDNAEQIARLTQAHR